MKAFRAALTAKILPGGLDLGQLSVAGGGLLLQNCHGERFSWSFPWRGVKASLPWLGNELDLCAKLKLGSFSRFGFPVCLGDRGRKCFLFCSLGSPSLGTPKLMPHLDPISLPQEEGIYRFIV